MNVPQGEIVERPFAESFGQFLELSTPAEVSGWVPADVSSTIGPVLAVVAVVSIVAALYSRTLKRE